MSHIGDDFFKFFNGSQERLKDLNLTNIIITMTCELYAYILVSYNVLVVIFEKLQTHLSNGAGEPHHNKEIKNVKEMSLTSNEIQRMNDTLVAVCLYKATLVYAPVEQSSQ